jgi:succinate dehydrogenase / fumarate reductase cytochrome b subunit
VNGLAGSLIGKLVLFGYTWALIHHMFGGVRHFIWDTGAGFEKSMIEFMVRASIVASLGLTVLIWGLGLHLSGALLPWPTCAHH